MKKPEIQMLLVMHGGNLKDCPQELKDEFLQRYNEITDEINVLLPRINKRWDGIYSGTMEVDSYIWDLYGQFVSSVERDVCIENNFNNFNSRIVMDSIPKKGEPKIVGYIDRNPDVYLEVFSVRGE